MPFRGKSVRRKIVALMLVPLVSLIALWVFAALVTGDGVLGLRDVRQLTGGAVYPGRNAVEALGAERRAALVGLAAPGDTAARTALGTAERNTDAALRSLRGHDADPALRSALDPASLARLDAIVRQSGGLAALRAGVAAHHTGRAVALRAYDGLIDPYYAFFLGLRPLPNVTLDRQGQVLVELLRAREAVSREDAVLSAAQAAGGMTRSEQRDFGAAVDRQRSAYTGYAPLLPGADGAAYPAFWHGDHDALALRADEERVLDAPASGAAGQVPRAAWRHTADTVQARLSAMDRTATGDYVRRVDSYAGSELLHAALAIGFGLVAVLISVVVSLRVGRGIARDMSDLRAEAQEAAGTRLPALMRRLAAGEIVDPETEVPRRERRDDEVGAVGAALDALGRAAVEAAVRQAALRRGVSDVFVNLARRNQVLLHRQLTLLDTMERRTEDTAELADLFRLDHLTTRMRRHAEGLVILSGAAPSRQWRNPVPLIDVVRAAVAEVEDYERVEVRRLARLALSGSAVADVTHLLAELIENAAIFSPPHTKVQVHGERSGDDFRLEIDDRGLGLPPEPLLAANLKLGETPEFELSDTDRLGLFVVARLARRTGVRVTLGPSPYGGTTATVLLPASLLSEREDDDTASGGLPLSAPAARRIAGERGAARDDTPPPAPAAPATVALPPAPAAGEARENAEEAFREWGIEPTADTARDLAAAARRRSLRRFDVPEDPDHQQAADAPQDVRPPRLPEPPATAGRPPAQQPSEKPLAGPHDAPSELPSGTPDASDITGDNAPLPRRRRGTSPAIGSGPGGRDHLPAARPGEPSGGPADPAGRAAVPPGFTDPGPMPPARETGPAGPAEAWSRAPGPAEPWGSPPAERGAPGSRIPVRLPRRVRQASLAPQLREPREPGAAEPAEASAGASFDRDPDEVRSRMASFQRGWERGRLDADDEAVPARDAERRTIRTRPPHDTGNSGGRAAGTTMEGDGR